MWRARNAEAGQRGGQGGGGGGVSSSARLLSRDCEQIEKSAVLGFQLRLSCGLGLMPMQKSPKEYEAALGELRDGVRVGRSCGLEVHGGHGLTYRNVAAVAAIEDFSEFNIGHSIIARAVFVGLRHAVREMKELLDRYGPKE